MNKRSKKRGRLNVLALSGAAASLFYLAHVIAGRLIWPEYNPLAQPISDLTAASAVSRSLASRILYGYDFFNLLFCFVLLLYFRKVERSTAFLRRNSAEGSCRNAVHSWL